MPGGAPLRPPRTARRFRPLHPDHLGRSAGRHAGGITLYHQGDVRAALPAVSMLQAQGGNTVLNSGTLRLSATAQADETTENSIVGWSWTSDLAGPLCTTAGECAYSATDLQLGEHTISLRVQDRLGNWSTEATTTVTVAERLYTYLPSMLGGGATR